MSDKTILQQVGDARSYATRERHSNYLLEFLQISLGLGSYIKLAEFKTPTGLEIGDNSMRSRPVSPFMCFDSQALNLFKRMLAHSQPGHRGFPTVSYNTARAIEANRRTDSEKRSCHE